MTDNIFGKKIIGDISHRSGGMVAQDDPAVLVAALDAILAIPEIESVRWEQSTPYFNDGDPCEFSIYDIRVRLVGTAEDDDSGDYADGYHDAWSLTYKNGEGLRSFVDEGTADFVTDEVAAIINAANAAVAGGTHYIVLNELFGDPAQVVATKDGFSVEYYDHD